jgi:hypothetical protein
VIIEAVYPNGYTIFADDVRHEIGGKLTIVGAYAGELNILGELPARLTNLACVIRFQFIPPDEPMTVDCKVILETLDREETQLFGAYVEIGPLGQNEDPFNDGRSFAEARIATQMPGLEITAPGRIKVRAYMPNGDEVRLGSLRIIATPPPPADASNAAPAS